MKVQAVIPCAGLGVRLKSARPKPLIALGGKPIFVNTLKVLESHASVQSVILVVHKKHLAEYKRAVKKFDLKKVAQVIAGGADRSASVRNGLKVLDQDTEFVLIHDAVRPFVTKGMITKLIAAVQKDKAVIAAVPVKPTIKAVRAEKMTVDETLDRSVLWEVQTPQVFERGLINRAYQRFPQGAVTDDAALVEAAGHPVRVLMGDYRNIKITTEDDLIFAGALMARRKK